MRKNNYLFLSLCSFILLIPAFYSCCHEHGDDEGIILSLYKISDGPSHANCLKTPDTACIRTDSELTALFVLNTTSDGCSGLSLPTIDFNKYSLLVNRKKTGGRIFFHRNVKVDSANKTVTYQITTTKCFCPDKCANDALNIVVVPKIGNDYKIIYI